MRVPPLLTINHTTAYHYSLVPIITPFIEQKKLVLWFRRTTPSWEVKEGDRGAVLVLYVCRLSPFPFPSIPAHQPFLNTADNRPRETRATPWPNSHILFWNSPCLNSNEYDAVRYLASESSSTSTPHFSRLVWRPLGVHMRLKRSQTKLLLLSFLLLVCSQSGPACILLFVCLPSRCTVSCTILLWWQFLDLVLCDKSGWLASAESDQEYCLRGHYVTDSLELHQLMYSKISDSSPFYLSIPLPELSCWDLMCILCIIYYSSVKDQFIVLSSVFFWWQNLVVPIPLAIAHVRLDFLIPSMERGSEIEIHEI